MSGCLHRKLHKMRSGIIQTWRNHVAQNLSNNGYESIPNPELSIHSDRLHGVSEIEALATVWSSKSLYLGYAMTFSIFFVNSFQQQTTGSLSPYAFSAFTNHSLISATNVLVSIIGGVSKLPTAMLIDFWGRPEGFGVMVGLCTLGLLFMAICRNIEIYVAAQVVYWIGYNGMDYVLHVFMSDTTDLVNRAFVYGLASTPYIVTTFAGPAAAQWFYKNGAMWWGFAIFVIVTPVVTSPLLILLWRARLRARNLGLLQQSSTGRTCFESLKHYFVKFDTTGLALITGGFVLVLLPLTLVTTPENMWTASPSDRWKSPDIVAMLFMGVLCFIVFIFWEQVGSSMSFIPLDRLKDRTLLGACVLSAALFASFYCWDLYLASYLQVVFDTTIQETGFIYNIYTIGTCIWSVPLGLLVRKVDRLKWIALAALPLVILGTCLMIPFRSPNTPIKYVIFCEVVKSLAGGTLVICQQMAAMATGGHETVAVSFALLGLFGKIGSGVGSAISGAIWTGTVPVYLENALPVDRKHKAAQLYGSISEVLSYPVGSPERDATVYAYGMAQRRMLIAGLPILPIAVLAVLGWNDIRLKNAHQVRGTVF
ncbi:putative transporter [Aspergillus ambiguus]|uniref:putative transporter n=1 Tax=Aspergillus ambiguus TaxID=176160 RepID=UPI003CCD2428